MSLRDTYPGTTAAELLNLAEGSAFNAVVQTLREEMVESLQELSCAQDPERVLDAVRRLQVLEELADAVRQAGAAAKKEIR